MQCAAERQRRYRVDEDRLLEQLAEETDPQHAEQGLPQLE